LIWIFLDPILVYNNVVEIEIELVGTFVLTVSSKISFSEV